MANKVALLFSFIIVTGVTGAVVGQPGAASLTLPSIRGTWVSTYSCSSSPAAMAACVRSLHALGCNHIYVDAWHNGAAYFQSPTMQRLLGSSGQAEDLLGWAVKAVQDQGLQSSMSVVAWMEYGLVAAPAGTNTPFAMKARALGWTLGEANGFEWLDAGNTQVRNFLCALLGDVRRNYPTIAAVQLDDHFAMPTALPGASVQVMTAAAEAVSANVSSSPGPPVTLAPATLEFARTQLNVDWAAWLRQNLFPVFTPQIYRLTSAEFASELDYTNATLGGLSRVVAGVRATGNPETTWQQLLPMLKLCEAYGVGQVVWDVRAPLTVYPAQFREVWGRQ